MAFKRGRAEAEVTKRLDTARRVFRGLKPAAAIMASRCEAGGGEQFTPTELEES